MKGKISKLAVRFIAGILFLGILICGFSATIGYQQYKKSLQSRYRDFAYNIAEQAQSYIDMDLAADYLELIKDDIAGKDVSSQIEEAVSKPEYSQIRSRLVQLRTSMKANDIFLIYLERQVLDRFDGTIEGWNPVHYLFDSYQDENLSYHLGNSGPFNPQYVQDAITFLETGKKSDSDFISESQFGYNTYAMQPIPLGEDVLLLVVELPMSNIQQALHSYILSNILVTFAVVLIVILIYGFYLLRRVIRPINVIATEASTFLENGISSSGSLEKICTGDEIQNLASGVLKMQTDINNYISNLTRITAERERISAELDVAKNIQASMLPCIFPAYPERKEFDIFASMCPAKEVGGDFYDFFLTDDNHLVMIVADVSGKGVPAALFMMISKILLKSSAHAGLSPKEILEKVNNQLCENNGAEMFVTVWMGKLDLTTGEMTCANAGHEYPVICRQNQFELYKDRHGFVLAGMENMHYREYTLQMNPGDILYMYTDGVTEATNGSKELYGTDRMVSALNSCSRKDPETISLFMKEDIDRFVGDAEQFDDITMLCMKYNGFSEHTEESSNP